MEVGWFGRQEAGIEGMGRLWEAVEERVESWSRLRLHTSQVAHQAGAYPGFFSKKWVGVFLLPPG